MIGKRKSFTPGGKRATMFTAKTFPGDVPKREGARGRDGKRL